MASESISGARLAAAALASVVLCAAVAGVRAPGLGVALMPLLVAATLIDLERRVIPNRLTLAGALAALTLLALTAPGALAEHAVAGAGAGGFLLAAHLIKPDGMGMGDVKLAGVLGLFLGRAVVEALLVALLAGSLAALVIGLRQGRGASFAFGPYLALGGVVGALTDPS